MKKTIGLIAVIAVIVFAFTACSLENETTKETKVPGKTLADKLQWLNDHKEDKGCYLIELTGSGRLDGFGVIYSSWEYIDPQTLPSNCSIRMKGVGIPPVIQLSRNGSLFTVSRDVTLVLDNISLVGTNDNTYALISVSDGGRLIMKQGSKISGNANTSSSAHGGGVYVRDGGTFIMNGGEISGNSVSGSSSAYGGGVYVGFRGTFTMNGGEISGNSVSASVAYGGGVYVDGGTFRIVNGTVYGSDAAEGLRNTVTGDDAQGAALYNEGTAQCGTFSSKTTFSNETWSGKVYDLVTTNNSITVENGREVGGISGGDPGIGVIIAPVWYEGGEVSLTEPELLLSPRQVVIEQGWQISDNAFRGWMIFYPPYQTIANMSYDGKYLRYYAETSDGQTYYSNVVIISVISGGPPGVPVQREVTIDMYASYGYGWDGSLIIILNGDYIGDLVKVYSGYSISTYTFPVATGDFVELYWKGYGQADGSFIVYYTDTPPNPEFPPWSGSWFWVGDNNALVYRLYGTMSDIYDDELLGSFIVP